MSSACIGRGDAFRRVACARNGNRADGRCAAPKVAERQDDRACRRKLHGKCHASRAKASHPCRISDGKGLRAERNRLGGAVAAPRRCATRKRRVPAQAKGLQGRCRRVGKRWVRTLHAEGNRLLHCRRSARHPVRHDCRDWIRQTGKKRRGIRRACKPQRRGIPRCLRQPHAGTAAGKHEKGSLAADKGGATREHDNWQGAIAEHAFGGIVDAALPEQRNLRHLFRNSAHLP